MTDPTPSTPHPLDELSRLIDFVLSQPLDEECVAMDCSDACEDISRLAERVANGERLEDIMPEFERHMKHWRDCREEFEALVAILKAERAARDAE